MSTASRLGWATAGLVALLMAGLPTNVARVLANFGMILLSRASVEAAPAAVRQAWLSRAASLAGGARSFGGAQPTVAWVSGRVALAANRPGEAAQILSGLAAGSSHDLFLLVDLVRANCRADLIDAAIDAYQRRAPDMTSAILQEEGATAYLLKARAMLRNRADEAEPWFRKAIAVRPGDLASQRFFLAQAVVTRGGESSPEQLRHLVRRFPLSAIQPGTSSLGQLTGQAILELFSDGAWDEKQVLDVVAFLVWQHSDVQWVGELVGALAARHPDQGAWRFYLAEWYQRRGDLPQAVSEYEHLLRDAPGYARAYLRLGSLYLTLADRNRDAASLQAAFGYYTRYQLLASSDLLGVRQVRETARRLGRQVPGELEAVWQDATNDVGAAARLAQTTDLRPPTLGPNLIEFTDLTRDNPGTMRSWSWLDQATGHPSNEGLFAGGGDNVEAWSSPGLRISGLWLDVDESKSPGAFGARSPAVRLEPHAAYLLTCYYRTDRLDGRAANIYASDDPVRVIPGGDIKLPATGGEWRRFVGIVPNPSAMPVTIIPLLRSLAVGDVWFDDVEMRRLFLPDGHVPQVVVTRVRP